jgi:pimeloyl-ACP methyl ester carboxylesterase
VGSKLRARPCGVGPFEKLTKLYEVIGRVSLQRHLHYAVAQKQQQMEAVDQASNIMGCTSGGVVTAFMKEGYLSDRVPSVASRIKVPTLLVAGRSSHVIGKDNIRRASGTWGAPVVWLDAGHFVYFEKPHKFVAVVVKFLDEVLG